MMYDDLVKDFAVRTKHNMAVLMECQEQGVEVFEVTQLINSCLGLLVLPRERYMHEIPKIPIKELEEDGWPIPKVTPKSSQVKNLNELISYLRHAIAHGNIEFQGGNNNKIFAIKVWNKKNGKDPKNWEAILGLKELRGLLDRFSDLIINLESNCQ